MDIFLKWNIVPPREHILKEKLCLRERAVLILKWCICWHLEHGFSFRKLHEITSLFESCSWKLHGIGPDDLKVLQGYSSPVRPFVYVLIDP